MRTEVLNDFYVIMSDVVCGTLSFVFLITVSKFFFFPRIHVSVCDVKKEVIL